MAKRLFKVLTIDGGGIRGIVPAVILSEVERQLGKPLSECFDLIVGTSTGGLVACGLTAPDPAHPGKPLYRAADLINFYETEGPKIFKKSFFSKISSIFDPKFDNKPLREALDRAFGGARLRQSTTSLVVTGYNISTPERMAMFMKHRHNYTYSADDRDFKMKDVALATSAAPTYFKPVEIFSVPPSWKGSRLPPTPERFAMIDGGVFASNPGLVGYIEALKMMEDLKRRGQDTEVMMLSVGTGTDTAPYKLKDAQDWGYLGWINPGNGVPIISAMMHGQSSAVDHQLNLLLNRNGPAPDRFLRLDRDVSQPGIGKPTPDGSMDNASPENLAALKQFALTIVEANKDKITAMVKAIKDDLAKGPSVTDINPPSRRLPSISEDDNALPQAPKSSDDLPPPPAPSRLKGRTPV